MESPAPLVTANTTGHYSPVTLSHEWSTLNRLITMVVCGTLGSIMNGFFVAAFFTEDNLKRLGNVFLACVGISDLFISSGVMPVCAVVLLSGQWDNVPVCKSLQFVTESATYCYSAFFALVAAETFYRLCRSEEEYQAFLSIRIGLVCVFVFILCFLTGGTGVFLELDSDYCRRTHVGNIYYRMATLGICHGIPFLVTVFCLLYSIVCMRRRANSQIHYKRSLQYEQDASANNLNITAYVLYVCGWIPYLIISNEHPPASDGKFYHSVWVGVCRSIFTSLIYCLFNANFRRAFARLFYYCFCKSTVTGPMPRPRVVEYRKGKVEVKVHIMHHAVSTNSPQASASRSDD